MIRIQVETILPDQGGGIQIRIYDTLMGPAPEQIYHIPISSYYRHLEDDNDGRGFQFWDFIMLCTAMLLRISIEKLKQHKVKLFVDGDQWEDPHGDWANE